jgi:hypothetical protein
MMVEIARARMSCFNQIPPPIPASGPRRVHPGQEAMPVADRALATFSIAAHLIADLKAEVEARLSLRSHHPDLYVEHSDGTWECATNVVRRIGCRQTTNGYTRPKRWHSPMLAARSGVFSLGGEIAWDRAHGSWIEASGMPTPPVNPRFTVRSGTTRLQRHTMAESSRLGSAVDASPAKNR